MRAARPAKPFASGSALDYALHVANFERVTNRPTSSSKDKIEEMKQQARIKAEMVNAYRVGDEQTRKKLQRRLNPDEN